VLTYFKHGSKEYKGGKGEGKKRREEKIRQPTSVKTEENLDREAPPLNQTGVPQKNQSTKGRWDTKEKNKKTKGT